MNTRQRTIAGTILARTVAMSVVAGLGLGALHLRWRATADDIAAIQVGDGLIAEPRYRTTRSISIQADPATIWAWLIQIGAGRGGFYSFDRLENMAGMKIRSADGIVPELQRLAKGDIVPLGPSGGPTVEVIEPGRSLVLRFVMDPFSARPVDRSQPGTRRWFDWTWAFLLRPVDSTTTRLTARTRADFAPRLLVGPLVAVLVAPIHSIMEWRMLWGIKRRAEAQVSD